MTLPYERRNAVNRTREFLYELLDPKKTPRVPKPIREQAYRCLKHYPLTFEMERAAEEAPDIFGDWQVSKSKDPIDDSDNLTGC